MMSVPPVPSLTLLSDLPGGEAGHDFSPGPAAECSSALDLVRSALGYFLEMPDETERWTRLQAVRRDASAMIARLPRRPSAAPFIHEVHELVREMAKSGVHDHAVAAADLAQAEIFLRKDWPGLLAAMLLVPAWQWPAAPLLMEVPDWLRPDYVRWLFAAPQSFSAPGQAEHYTAHTLRRLEELKRWMNRAPEAKEELKVLGAYASHCSLLPACFGPENLRRHAELRGELLRRVMGRRDDHYRAPLKLRAGRRLRIGIVRRHFEPNPEVYATLPLFEQLDPERFEVVLFTYVSDFSRLEEYCRQKCADLIVLPADLKDQLALLRKSALDVVLFSTNVTAECNVVTRLALHRVAPLQVVHHASCVTSGLPEIDLYVTGALANPEGMAAQFSERLGLLPGPTHTFNFEADREEAQVVCTRADFGLPEDAIVFVATANFRKIIPEVQQVWARVLAATPGSYLLLHPFYPNPPSTQAITHFHAEFERILRDEGVDHSRLVASTVDFPSRDDVQSFVGLGDVYLDSFPFSGVDSLVEPLALGLPVVTCAGDTLRSRTGASLLHSLGMGELVASSVAGYQALAVMLATDAVYRESCGARVRLQMERAPVFLDSKATSQAFGELMELAFDEVRVKGPALFRANTCPLALGGGFGRFVPVGA